MADLKSSAWPSVPWRILALALGGLVFASLIYGVGPQAILVVLRHLGAFTPLIILPYAAAYVLDSLGWWWVLRREVRTSEAHPGAPPGPLCLFAIRAAGEAVNAITPTAYLGGEPIKAWLLRQHHVPLVLGLASVLVSKTALMLTQGAFVFLGTLFALHRLRPTTPLPLAGLVGLVLGVLVFATLIGLQRRGLFTFLLGLSRRLSGREALLASWEPDLRALDERLRGFYGGQARHFLVCCGFHFLGWTVGSLEVYVVLGLLGSPVDLPTALSIEALAGVAKLAAVLVPGSLGAQEGGQVLIFLAYGLSAPLAVAFSLLRRGRELLWIAFGLGVLAQQHALGWLRRSVQRRAPGAGS